jgi:hypothetical protein
MIGKSNLPEMCCFPGEGMFEDMPEGQTAEWYFKKLKEKIEEQGEGEGSGEGGEGEGKFDPDAAGQFDDHGGWGDIPEDMKEIAKERLKEATKKASFFPGPQRDPGSDHN